MEQQFFLDDIVYIGSDAGFPEFSEISGRIVQCVPNYEDYVDDDADSPIGDVMFWEYLVEIIDEDGTRHTLWLIQDELMPKVERERKQTGFSKFVRRIEGLDEKTAIELKEES